MEVRITKQRPFLRKTLVVLGVIICIALAALGGLGMSFGLLGMPQ